MWNPSLYNPASPSPATHAGLLAGWQSIGNRFAVWMRAIDVGAGAGSALRILNRLTAYDHEGSHHLCAGGVVAAACVGVVRLSSIVTQAKKLLQERGE